MMENNYVFIKKIHLKTQSKKKDVLVISKYRKKPRIFIYLTKLYSRERQTPYVNKVDLNES